MVTQTKVRTGNPWREQSKVNPQRENGHREIENKVFQALMAAKLPGAVYQIVLTVIDRTWGFTKHKAPISFSYFQEATRLKRQSVNTAIKKAESMKLIVIEKHGRNPKNPSHYMFNKHYDTWLTSQPNHTSKDSLLVNQIIPDWSTKSYQTSQLATPSTPMPKENSKENSKESITSSEKELLIVLKGFPGWQYKRADDIRWLRELMADFDNVSSANLKACRDYHSDKPSKKGPWKNRIRQWLTHDRTFKAQENSSERKSKFNDGW